jgi:DNA-binding transcriptional LysR family regulator
VMVGLRRGAGPVRLAASHSATEAFVADMLAARGGEHPAPVELVIANSPVVRGMVADGRADLGVAAGRAGGTPNPGVRQVALIDDEIVCAVPRGHPWAQRGRVTQAEFLRTPMVVRDPESSARRTVDTGLRERGLAAAPPLTEASTPSIARREGLARNAPVLLSRRVLTDGFFVAVGVDGLAFPRRFELVLPAVGEPAEDARELAALVRRAAASVENTDPVG